MKYSAWNDGHEEFTFVPGTEPPKGEPPGLQLEKVFEAESWEDATRQYHEWLTDYLST